ncbi:hypothetical protein EDC01DRAFT_608967 [Geopyxis carbonaria]|nr:hypothetical protein EDC01DRAFT_608967 [Geopyxis carbonaria]
MAHFIYKKPLQSEKVREKYIGDRNDLRRARDAGILDPEDYKTAKRNIPIDAPTAATSRGRADSETNPWPSRPTTTRTNSVASSKSTSSGGSIPPVPSLLNLPLPPKPKAKKGTIFDRNNVTVRMFKPEAQSEEAREELKRRRKLEEWAKAEEQRAAEGRGLNIEGSFEPGADSPPILEREWSVRGSTGESSSSRSVPRNMPSVSMAGFGGLSPEMYGVPAHNPKSPTDSEWSRARSSSMYSAPSSATSDARKPSLPTIEDEPIPPIPTAKPTWADRYVFGNKGKQKENYAKSIASRTTARRHSYASSERPSFTGSRRRSVASDDKFIVEPGEGELPYGLTNGYDDTHWTPPSMLLLDLFTSLINEFGSTPKLFKFAKSDEPQGRPSFSSSVVGWTESEHSTSSPRQMHHPGHEVVFDEELSEMKSILTDRVWFLMALKWLYFGRVLFSPGHHLLQLGPNQRRIQIPSHTELLSRLPAGSFDVISSRNLPRFIKKVEWLPLLQECYRLLKHDGYLEFTILDPVFNDMGPLTRQWILDNVLADHPRTFDIMPSKTILSHLASAGFGEVNKVWMWMPATSIGDELSTVTSKVGRYMYDELYHPSRNEREKTIERPVVHEELGMWSDPTILKECMEHNTAFRWLKCYARKPDLATN